MASLVEKKVLTISHIGTYPHKNIIRHYCAKRKTFFFVCRKWCVASRKYYETDSRQNFPFIFDSFIRLIFFFSAFAVGWNKFYEEIITKKSTENMILSFLSLINVHITKSMYVCALGWLVNLFSVQWYLAWEKNWKQCSTKTKTIIHPVNILRSLLLSCCRRPFFYLMNKMN